MDTIRFPTELREFLKLLGDHHVEYLLIGGYAVGYHGYPRATADMDIWIAADLGNAQKVMAALNEFGFGDTGMTADLFTKPDQIVRMGNTPLRIEIVTTISGVNFAESYRERVVDEIDGVAVSVISREHLETNKRASGRLKDLADLDNLP
jgi:predicted nucleotidyltransferase